MPSNALTYSQYTEIVSPLGHMSVNVDKLLHELNMGQISAADASSVIENVSGRAVTPQYDKTGRVYTGFNYVKDATATTGNAFNSNATTVNRGTIRTPITTTIDPVTNTVKAGKIVPPSQVGTRAYVMNSVASPLIAVATGITLGKTIDSALYNVNPGFWDSRGMSSLNPETWNRITSGLDTTDPITGVSAGMMNLILGLDPETSESQAYIDQEALAYMAAYINSKGAFAEGEEYITPETLTPLGLIEPIYVTELDVSTFINFGYPRNVDYLSNSIGTMISSIYGAANVYVTSEKQSIPPFKMTILDKDTRYNFIIASDNASTFGTDNSMFIGAFTDEQIANKYGQVFTDPLGQNNWTYTYNGKTVYYRFSERSKTDINMYTPFIPLSHNNEMARTAWAIVYGETEATSPYEGIGTQTGAQTPDTSTWGDYANVMPSLQQQYPELWNNAIDYPVVQPDGTVDNRKYIPISLPQSFTEGQSTPYTQPISSGATQANPKIDPAANPEFADWVARLLQQPTDNPLDTDYTPPANPADTGEGSTPLPIAPTGSASALWSIYHPTQNEVDAFGAWLWSPSFIDQLAKIFNDPMQSIIGLHKVYATPVDAGTSTIAVGYLDSGVSSAYITQQYVTVDCGTVDVYETFGNVFDYTPYTDVKLYLPFVGIVSLDVADVMRGSLHISYEVDVLTGACLAVVTVNRDGNSAVMYQYAGNCAVQYPLSSGSYMGIVSSIIGVAGTVAATIATGGSVAPLAIGAAGAAMSAHTTVQNSGSFSGNAGAMGGKKPYLIIKRPQSKMADEQQNFVGTPTNEVAKVGDYSGFMKCRSAHVEGINATSTELKMITDYLLSGILV